MLNPKANKDTNNLDEITKQVLGEQITDLSSIPKSAVSIFDFLDKSPKTEEKDARSVLQIKL